MFANLSDNLGKIFDKLKGRGALTEGDIDAALREIRIALLEADVSVPAIKCLIERIKAQAIGQEIIKSITPGQMVVKIVQDELTKFLSSEDQKLNLNYPAPVSLMMVGLQGSGKTTSSAKLALFLRKTHKKKVLLVSLDIYRPAAQLQLESLAKQISIDSLEIINNQSVEQIAKRGMEEARLGAYDIVIFDTAGRLHTDDEMMDELKVINNITNPSEIMLVLDSMTGQDAVNIGKYFSDKINLTGVMLTRVDGDARGGAALSMKHITNVPIKFMGVGEKISDLEQFYPDRAASRILGMGDIVSLVEKAAESVDQAEANRIAQKMQKGSFDMDDLLKQLKSVQKMGGIASMLGMVPGLGKMKKMIGDVSQGEVILKQQEAIINSMTKKERKDPKIINASRKKRIASGAGRKVQDVNRLLKQFLEMQNMMKKVGKMEPNKIKRMLDAFN